MFTSSTLRASPSVLARVRPHRSVLVVVVIVLKVRRVSVQQHVPVVIESIKHPKPHHRAETRAQRLVRERRVAQRHALVRHAAALARCADAKHARTHRQSFVPSSLVARKRRASRARAREAWTTDRSNDRGRRGTRRGRTVSARGGAMGALCGGQTHSRAEAQKGAARRGHGDATRRTRSAGRGFARGGGAKTRPRAGRGRDGGRNARAREESDDARAMVTRGARVDAL